MTTENEKHYCYKHPNKETRLKCTDCGKYICSSCVIQAPVGQKCPDCVASKTTHLEKITTPQLIKAIIVGVLTATVLGYFWQNYGYGIIGLILAYLIGFCVCWAIKKTIGIKIGRRIQLTYSISVIIGMLYNPITLFYEYTENDNSVTMLLVKLKQPYFDFISIFSGDYNFIWIIISIAIAVWATTRHSRT